MDQLVKIPWERLTSHTLATPELLHLELDQVRAGDFAYDRGETSEGVTCIALPVHKGDQIPWGIGVTTPAFRLDQHKEALIKEVLAASRATLESLLA